jgi:hypothetical protein
MIEIDCGDDLPHTWRLLFWAGSINHCRQFYLTPHLTASYVYYDEVPPSMMIQHVQQGTLHMYVAPKSRSCSLFQCKHATALVVPVELFSGGHSWPP